MPEMLRLNLPVGIAAIAALANAGCGSSQSAADAASTVVDASGFPGDAARDADVTARVLVSWTLEGGCRAGDDIETQIVNMADGRTFLQRVPCLDVGESLSEPLSVGEIDVLVRVIDNDVVVDPDAGPGAAPGPLLAQSDLSGPHQVTPGLTLDIDFSFPTGTSTITSTWSFASTEGPQDCAAAGVLNIDLVLEEVGVGIVRQLRIPCTDGVDLSGDVATGSYIAYATPLDAGDAAVFPQSAQSVPLFVGNLGGSANFSFGTLE